MQARPPNSLKYLTYLFLQSVHITDSGKEVLRQRGPIAANSLIHASSTDSDHGKRFTRAESCRSGLGSGRAQLCPHISDVNLFSYCQGIVDLDAEIPDRALDLGMPEQELDGPQVAGAPIDQGSFCAS